MLRFFIISLFCLTSVTKSFALAPNKIRTKKGNFYCTEDGKLIIAGSSGNMKVICSTPKGVKYDGMTGEIIGEEKTPTKNQGKKPNEKTVINNYYEEVFDETAKKKRRGFGGFYIGLGYGLSASQLDHETTMPDPDPTRPPITQNWTERFTVHKMELRVGANLSLKKNIVLGLDFGGYVMSNFDISLPGGVQPEDLSNYISGGRGLSFLRGRFGVSIRDIVLIYGGVGFEVNKIYEELYGDVGPWTTRTTIKVSPSFAAGIDFLIKSHFLIRLEYAFTLQNKVTRSSRDEITGEQSSFFYKGYHHNFSVVLGYKF